MITEAVVAAIDLLVEICGNQEQSKGMLSVREMLCDFAEDEWLPMNEEERREWLAQFLSCRMKKGG